MRFRRPGRKVRVFALWATVARSEGEGGYSPYMDTPRCSSEFFEPYHSYGTALANSAG